MNRFYQSLAPMGCLVYDIGANVGEKTKLFRKLGVRVVAVEPDNSNYTNLTKLYSADKNVEILPYAVSDENGTSDFHVMGEGSAFNTLSSKWKETLENPDQNRWHTSSSFSNIIKVKTVTLDYLIEHHGKPDYIKIDVEGHELACIKGLSQKVKAISFEANLPEFTNESIEIINLLERIDTNVLFNYARNDERYEASVHMTANEFREFLNSTSLRYMEVFCFMN